jgi:hypothetical protein
LRRNSHLTISSCTCTRTNQEGDKKEAEKVASKFYGFIKNKEFRKTFPLFTKQFFQENDTSKFFEFLEQANQNLGDLNEFELDDWQTNVSVGSITSGQYILKYKTKYGNKEVAETFTMLFENEKGVKITAYNISMDSFIK